MRWIDAMKRKPAENGVYTLINFIRELRVPVTTQAIQKVKDHKEYPSLLSFSDMLADWNIDSLAVKIPTNQLTEIPLPAIAHIQKNNGHFVVLQKVESGFIYYNDSDSGNIQESIDEFVRKWTGVLLLASADEKSGEQDYVEKRNKEYFNRISAYIVFILLGFCLASSVFNSPAVYRSFYFLKIMGLVLCSFLLQKQFGNSSTYLNSLCRLGSKSDCNAVINSPASKLFGVIHLSEIGLFYFAGGLIAMLFSSPDKWDPVMNSLMGLNFITLPFTAFSVYYQGVVLKKWCPLCLAVMAVLWLEFFAHFLISSQRLFYVNSFSFYVIFLSFSLPVIFWLSIRPRFTDGYRLEDLQSRLNLFVKNGSIFWSILRDQKSIDMGSDKFDLKRGNPQAPITLTMVSNPTCAPCKLAHRLIDDLLNQFPEKVNVHYRFMIKPNEMGSVSGIIARHILAESTGSDNVRAVQLLSQWYLTGKREKAMEWIHDNPLQGVVDMSVVDHILQDYYSWAITSGVAFTPTIFINNKMLPEAFKIVDLHYHIRQMVSNNPVNDSETIS